jgi:rod shape-determining protein MreC
VLCGNPLNQKYRMQKTVIGSKKLFLVFLALGVLLLLSSWGVLQGPKNAVISVLSPTQSGFVSSSNIFGDFFYTMQKIGEFKDENKKLQEENNSLTYELSQMQEVQRENGALREELKFKENLCTGTECIDFKMGKIIAQSSDGYGQSITINLGSEDGAWMNQAVTSSGGVMIGKIVEVLSDYSKVALIVSPESSVNCLAQTTRANGLVKGAYGMGAKLEMIDQSEELVSGDIVITSGREEGIPKGLLLGKIQNIEASPNMVFKTAELELFADFGHIEEIFLVESK